MLCDYFVKNKFTFTDTMGNDGIIIHNIVICKIQMFRYYVQAVSKTQYFKK